MVNVYNAPSGAVDEGQGLDSLMEQTTPSHLCLIAEDFNLKHPAWQSSAQPSLRAGSFLSWAESQNLTLTLSPDSPTQGQNMIDLSWANSILLNLGISSEITADHSSLTDHEPILTIIKWGTSSNSCNIPSFQWAIPNEDLFQETLQGEKRHVDGIAFTLPSCSSPSQLDKLAASIIHAA